ncbi:unnamed protein product, partial [Prorocentrum cordatum]
MASKASPAQNGSAPGHETFLSSPVVQECGEGSASIEKGGAPGGAGDLLTLERRDEQRHLANRRGLTGPSGNEEAGAAGAEGASCCRAPHLGTVAITPASEAHGGLGALITEAAAPERQPGKPERERKGPALPAGLLGAAAAPAAPEREAGAARPAPVQNVVSQSAKTYTGEEVTVNPLAALGPPKPKAAAAAPSDKPRPTGLEALAAGDPALAGISAPPAAPQRPEPQAEEQASPARREEALRATIVSSSKQNDTTFYHIKLSDPGDPRRRTFQKRYNDFKTFDKTVRDRNPGLDQVLPQLPESGTFGVRHKLGLDDFERRRQDGLQ